jgi:alkylation response protein AidB-like acyl-CoA dehydrogenase
MPTTTPIGLALRAVRQLAGSDVLDRLGARDTAERLLYRGTRDGFRAIGTAGRTFNRVRKAGRPARLKTVRRGDLFDLTPTDEQQMLQEAFGAFAIEQLRPAALDADAQATAPDELLGQAAELGLTMLGVPEDLGGAVAERSTVTAVLAAESLAHGDMGLAVAALAPSGVASALTLWGDADQQATYLPEFVGESVPAAALAVLEPAALFDPFALTTTARESDGGYVLSGVKALVPRGVDAELLLVAADLEGRGPALFLVAPGEVDGVEARPAPAMGVRAAATADVRFDDVQLPATALLGDGDPAVYAEAIRRARLGWCALAVGTSRAVLDYVIPYVKERSAFGEPIANRQAVAFAISDIAIELEGMHLLTLRAASRADAGEDVGRDVALARRQCAELGAQIGSEGVQLLGGHGFVKEHPVERWYRDLRAVGVMEGALLV